MNLWRMNTRSRSPQHRSMHDVCVTVVSFLANLRNLNFKSQCNEPECKPHLLRFLPSHMQKSSTQQKFGKLSTSARSFVDVGPCFMFCFCFDACTFLFRSTQACNVLFLAPIIYDFCMKIAKWSY